MDGAWLRESGQIGSGAAHRDRLFMAAPFGEHLLHDLGQVLAGPHLLQEQECIDVGRYVNGKGVLLPLPWP